jgi:hypothetical protein
LLEILGERKVIQGVTCSFCIELLDSERATLVSR